MVKKLLAKNTQFLRTATKYIKSFPKYQKKKEFYYYFSKKIYSQFFFVPYTTPSLSCCLYILFYSAINKKKHSFKKQNVKYKTPTRPIHDIFNFFFFIILRNQRNKPLKENLKKIAFYSSMEKKVIITYQKIVPSLL